MDVSNISHSSNVLFSITFRLPSKKKGALFLFPVFARPPELIADFEFRLDTQLRDLLKQGVKRRFGAEEGLRYQPHLPRWSIKERQEKVVEFRRTPSVPQTV
jgi:hypothetical protein